MSERPPYVPLSTKQDWGEHSLADAVNSHTRPRRGPAKPRVLRRRGISMPMSVYTSTDEPPAELMSALAQLLRTTGFSISHEGDVERGSWFRSWRVREATPGGRRHLARLAAQAERAGELRYIYGVRAEADEHEANAVATVIRTLDGVDSAVIQLSSMIIVKFGGSIIVRVLHEPELRLLRDHPELLKKPGDLFTALSEAAGGLDEPKAAPPVIGL
jgi:hypothetical protein